MPALRTAPRRSLASVRLFSTADGAPSAADIAGLQEKFGADASKAQAVFNATTELTSGPRSKMQIKDFDPVQVDEPLALGRTNTAPNVSAYLPHFFLFLSTYNSCPALC
jgi:hypothetical protein